MAKDLVLNIIMNATDKASAAFKKLRDGSNVLAKGLVKAEAELQRLDKAQQQLLKRNNLNKEINANSKAMMQNRGEVRKLHQEIEQAGKASKAQEAALKRLSGEHDKLAQRQRKNREEVGRLDKSLAAAGISAKTFGMAQEQLNRKHEAASRAVERQRAAYEKMDKATRRLHAAPMVAAGFEAGRMYLGAKAAAIGRTLQAPVKAYAQSETASTDLRAAMMKSDGSVSAEYEKINRLAIRLGDRLPGTTADFQNLMTMLMRQGISAQNILGGTGEAAALLSVQLKKTPEAAAEMAAKLQDATRGTEKEMTAIMDQVQRLYYTGVEDNNILGAFSRLSPALDTLKIKGEAAMKQMGPLVGMLDQAGLSGDSAGNALRKVFTRMMDVAKISKATKGSGISLDFTNGKGEFGGFDKMYAQLEKLKKLNTEARLGILQKIFGDDAETLQALNTMIEKGKAGYEEFAAKMEAQASLNQRVNDQLGTLNNLWDAASGTFINFLAKMGESVAPELKMLTKWIGSLNESLSAWAEKNPKTAAALMKTAGIIGVVLAALSAAAGVAAGLVLPLAALNYAFTALKFGPAIAGIGKLLGVLGRLGAALLSFGAKAAVFLVTNPFGWAILAVAALAALYIYWDEVKAALIQGWQWIDQTFADNPVLNFIFPIVGAARLLVNNWSSLTASLSAGWEWIKNAFRENPILYVLTGPVGMIALLIQNWERLKATLTAGWEWFKQLFRDNPIVAALAGPLGMVASLIANFDRLIAKARQLKEAFSGLNITEKINAPFRSIGRVFDGKGFSVGGYTGAGGVNEAAGIVHRGEVVFSQRDVAKFGGWRAVEAIRRGGAGLLARLAEKVSMPSGSSAPRNAGVQAVQRGGFAAVGASFGGDTITIHVHAAPGMSEAGIVEQIRRILDERDADKRRRANSSYRDRD
nr:MAG TPA: minor tail protein [Caudoviricetes sp.]